MIKSFCLVFFFSYLIAQGTNPLKWYPVYEQDRFIQQAWGEE